MRIINLKAENYKRLVAVEIKPDGSLVDIVGKNAQGKTSLLDAIFVALAGAGVAPKKPIHTGADKANIELTLGNGEKVELVVRRTFNRKGDDSFTTSVTVEAADGARYAQPQRLLDGLLGALSFDPLAFTRMSAKEQLEELRKLVPGFDFAAADGANARDYERRTDVNRKAKQIRAQLEAMAVPGDPRVTRVDEAALVQELEAVGEKKAEIERERARRAALQKTAEEHRATSRDWTRRIEEAKERISAMEEQIAGIRDAMARAETLEAQEGDRAVDIDLEVSKLPTLDEAPDTSAIKARIEAARKTNADVAERERVIAKRTELQNEAQSTEKLADALTESIAAREAKKTDAIAAAKLPIEGLGLGDDGVLFGGLPFDQASDAERLRVSVAIAAAMNPKLRVVRIRDGSLLDVDAVKALAAFAEANDLQVWREVVDDGHKTGILIEDGRLKASTETEAAA